MLVKKVKIVTTKGTKTIFQVPKKVRNQIKVSVKLLLLQPTSEPKHDTPPRNVALPFQAYT